MKLILLDINLLMIKSWQKYFDNEENVSIVNDSVENYLSRHRVDAVVTAGNSYGIMGGGFDLGVKNYFGGDLEKRVMEQIKKNSNSKQSVGTSFIIDGGEKNIKVIYTPTMEVPSRITDINIIYKATLSSLKIAKENNLEKIVLPAFGGATGGVEFEKIAERMKEAYEVFMKKSYT